MVPVTLSFKELFSLIEEFLELDPNTIKNNVPLDISFLDISIPIPSSKENTRNNVNISLDKISHIIKKTCKRGYKLDFEYLNDATKKISIKCADTHIFGYINEEKSDIISISADKLNVENKLILQNGEYVILKSKEILSEQEYYDISIQFPHYYYCSEGFIHHNTLICGCLVKTLEPYGKTLTIVPNKQLVQQTEKEYSNLGLSTGVFFGERKELDKHHTIATWQSLSRYFDKEPEHNWNEEIIGFIVDEVHSAKAKELNQLLVKYFAHVPIRWGLSGTIPKAKHDFAFLRSSIGPVISKISAKELQTKGVLSDLDIEMWKLCDNVDDFDTWNDEQTYLLENPQRLRWIAKKIQEISKSGNTLVLFNKITTGEILLDIIGKGNADFVFGMTPLTERKEFYDKINKGNNSIVLATMGVASVGINIPRIHNLVMIEPGKSNIRIIQSIGRGIRKTNDKTYLKVYDIYSTLRFSEKHANERKKLYSEQGYPYKVKKIIWI